MRAPPSKPERRGGRVKGHWLPPFEKAAEPENPHPCRRDSSAHGAVLEHPIPPASSLFFHKKRGRAQNKNAAALLGKRGRGREETLGKCQAAARQKKTSNMEGTKTHDTHAPRALACACVCVCMLHGASVCAEALRAKRKRLSLRGGHENTWDGIGCWMDWCGDKRSAGVRCVLCVLCAWRRKAPAQTHALARRRSYYKCVQRRARVRAAPPREKKGGARANARTRKNTRAHAPRAGGAKKSRPPRSAGSALAQLLRIWGQSAQLLLFGVGGGGGGFWAKDGASGAVAAGAGLMPIFLWGAKRGGARSSRLCVCPEHGKEKKNKLFF